MYVLFIMLETCQEKYACKFGHQASYILVIGILISAFVKFGLAERDMMENLKFDEKLFFYVCLPPIVFASGFNMHRGTFFQNIKLVMIFGVLGTIISFTMFSLMTCKMNEWLDMEQYDGKTQTWSTLQMEAREIVLMSSLLCSSDVIAAVSLVSYDQEPRLFSIIFGEGITNDAVSIILFNTVLKYMGKNTELDWLSPFEITGGFILLGAVSVLIGAVFGFATALFTKHFRSLSHNAINQAVIVLCFAMVSYVVSELFHESGIISLLVCGIVQAHYAYYNLSSLGQHASYVIFQFISFFSEAFVFIYLGISFFSFGDLKWCPMLILIEIFVIMIGRFIAVMGLLLFLKLCKYDSGLSFK
jgi:NhaP-type Na+/H+ or K+/H+ antiporter